MSIGEFLSGLNRWVVSVIESPITQAILVTALGLLAIYVVNRKLALRALPAQLRLLVRRGLALLVVGITVASILATLGVPLNVLLGAAGVLTVAIGFASQTSASNLISGIFLMVERPFVVGDLIRVDGAEGFVEAVDLISCRLRTFDNLLVRIPNETMLKSRVTNVSHFPIRRYDMKLGVSYGEDVEKVREVLMEVADRNPICLEEPAPVFIFLEFGDSGLNLQFSVWAARENYLALRNSIHLEVKRALDEAGIEIPFPHRSLHAGSRTGAFPVRLVGPHGESEGAPHAGPTPSGSG